MKKYGLEFHSRQVIMVELDDDRLHLYSLYNCRAYDYMELCLIFSSIYHSSKSSYLMSENYIDIFVDYKKWKLEK